MVLNNYWKLLYATCVVPVTTNIGSSVAVQMVAKDGMVVGSVFPNYNGLIGLRNGFTGLVGNGTAEENKEDYCLANDISSTLSNIVCSTNTEYVDGSVKSIITISGQNNTTEQKTITEIGVQKILYVSESNWGAGQKEFVLIRQLLNEPITVPSGDGFSITLEWVES